MINFLKTPLEYLDDFHKNKSSKRLWGCRLLVLGVILALGLFIVNVITPFVLGRALAGSHDNAYDIVTLFFATGGGLLFGGVFERLKK